ncbi:uncharacterized protein [Nicotiana tomentosiformis]|uniref:uncharacterized protein n=1 Tax=Nicotiana tomentosiformis TaxID=4098 RepID=UPI00388C9E06
MHEITEAQKLIQFISGLNEIYFTVKSNILMISPTPIVEKAYSILIRDEKQREVYSGSQPFSPDSTSFIASSHSNPSNNQSTNNMRNFNQGVNFKPIKSNLSCKYCKKPGHIMNKSYKLHGFPPDFKFTKGKRIAACVQVDSTDQPSSAHDSSQHEDVPHGFSKEQYAHLMSLFQQMQMSSLAQQSTSQDPPVYANFAGATNHMTPHKHLLHNIQPLLSPSLVTLPNSYKVKGPSLKRPLEIGKVEHGLYILRLPFSDVAAVDASPANVSQSVTVSPFVFLLLHMYLFLMFYLLIILLPL